MKACPGSHSCGPSDPLHHEPCMKTALGDIWGTFITNDFPSLRRKSTDFSIFSAVSSKRAAPNSRKSQTYVQSTKDRAILCVKSGEFMVFPTACLARPFS